MQWGMICPAETPEGQACGLVKNLALMAYISVGCASAPVLEFLDEWSMEALEEINPGVILEARRPMHPLPTLCLQDRRCHWRRTVQLCPLFPCGESAAEAAWCTPDPASARQQASPYAVQDVLPAWTAHVASHHVLTEGENCLRRALGRPKWVSGPLAPRLLPEHTMRAQESLAWEMCGGLRACACVRRAGDQAVCERRVGGHPSRPDHVGADAARYAPPVRHQHRGAPRPDVKVTEHRIVTAPIIRRCPTAAVRTMSASGGHYTSLGVHCSQGHGCRPAVLAAPHSMKACLGHGEQGPCLSTSCVWLTCGPSSAARSREVLDSKRRARTAYHACVHACMA